MKVRQGKYHDCDTEFFNEAYPDDMYAPLGMMIFGSQKEGQERAYSPQVMLASDPVIADIALTRIAEMYQMERRPHSHVVEGTFRDSYIQSKNLERSLLKGKEHLENHPDGENLHPVWDLSRFHYPFEDLNSRETMSDALIIQQIPLALMEL